MKTLARLKGVATVELAILLIPLVILTFGMTELGRAFYYYNGVVKSVRDATRHLSTLDRGVGEAQARCLAVYGQTSCSGDALVPGLQPTSDMVDISYQIGVTTGEGAIDLVTVSIHEFPYRTMMPAVVTDLLFGPIACTMRQGGS